VATLVAEDWAKFVVTGLIVLGAILQTVGQVDKLNEVLLK
jgi:hypothetical protein